MFFNEHGNGTKRLLKKGENGGCRIEQLSSSLLAHLCCVSKATFAKTVVWDFRAVGTGARNFTLSRIARLCTTAFQRCLEQSQAEFDIASKA